MESTETRTHVIMPTDLLEKIDARIGHRQRSKFIVELARREIARLELLDAAERVAVSPIGADVPAAWKTSEAAAQWVHDLRQDDLARQESLENVRAAREEAQ